MKFSTTAKMSTVSGRARDRRLRVPAAAPPKASRSGSARRRTKKALGQIALESGANRSSRYLNRYHTSSARSASSTSSPSRTSPPARWRTSPRSSIARPDLLADTHDGLALNTRKTIVSILSHEMAHAVVRRSGDDAVVGRHLAERRVRDLDGVRGRAAAMKRQTGTCDVSEALENQTALGLSTRCKSTHADSRQRRTRPREIESVFDPISYEKGAAVLRMIESYVGETRSARASTPISRSISTPTRRPRISSASVDGRVGQARRPRHGARS